MWLIDVSVLQLFVFSMFLTLHHREKTLKKLKKTTGYVIMHHPGEAIILDKRCHPTPKARISQKE